MTKLRQIGPGVHNCARTLKQINKQTEITTLYIDYIYKYRIRDLL